MTKTRYARSASEVLRAVGCSYLKLYRGEGYWYFIYDSGKVYESESVYTMRLNDMPLALWVQIGKNFVEKVKGT